MQNLRFVVCKMTPPRTPQYRLQEKRFFLLDHHQSHHILLQGSFEVRDLQQYRCHQSPLDFEYQEVHYLLWHIVQWVNLVFLKLQIAVGFFVVLHLL